MLDYQQPAYGPGKQSNGLGIASLVCGIVALCVSWIPFCGLLPALGLGAVGGILGLVGFIAAKSDNRTGTGFPIAGMVTCVLAITIGLLFTFGLAAVFNNAAQTAAKNAATTAARNAARAAATQPATAPAKQTAAAE